MGDLLFCEIILNLDHWVRCCLIKKKFSHNGSFKIIESSIVRKPLAITIAHLRVMQKLKQKPDKRDNHSDH